MAGYGDEAANNSKGIRPRWARQAPTLGACSEMENNANGVVVEVRRADANGWSAMRRSLFYAVDGAEEQNHGSFPSGLLLTRTANVLKTTFDYFLPSPLPRG